MLLFLIFTLDVFIAAWRAAEFFNDPTGLNLAVLVIAAVSSVFVGIIPIRAET